MLCHVSVHRVHRARDPISVAFFDQIKSRYFLILTIYLSYLDQVLLPIAVNLLYILYIGIKLKKI